MPKVVYVYDDFARASLGAAMLGVPSADANYPVENLLNASRKVRYRTTATPGTTVDLDIDLGASFNTGARTGEVVGGIGIHDLQTDAAYNSGPDIDIFAGSTYPGGLGVISGSALNGATYWHTPSHAPTRDWVSEFLTTYTHRYWRIRVTANNVRFSIGKIILGRALNLGILYSAGSEVAPPEAPMTVLETIDGDPVQFIKGPVRRRYRFLYGAQDDTARLSLDAIRRQTVPLSLIDSLGNSAHVIVKPGGGPFQHSFGSLWNADVEMVQLA